MSRLSLTCRHGLGRRKIYCGIVEPSYGISCMVFYYLVQFDSQIQMSRLHIRGIASHTDRYTILHRYAYESDIMCLSQLRMNRRCFARLCCMLETLGGLKATRYMNVDEQVAIFLHMIAHNVKNRVLTFRFHRS